MGALENENLTQKILVCEVVLFTDPVKRREARTDNRPKLLKYELKHWMGGPVSRGLQEAPSLRFHKDPLTKAFKEIGLAKHAALNMKKGQIKSWAGEQTKRLQQMCKHMHRRIHLNVSWGLKIVGIEGGDEADDDKRAKERATDGDDDDDDDDDGCESGEGEGDDEEKSDGDSEEEPKSNVPTASAPSSAATSSRPTRPGNTPTSHEDKFQYGFDKEIGRVCSATSR